MAEKVRRNWSGDALFLDRVELLSHERGLETERTSPESVTIVFPGGMDYQTVEQTIMDRAQEPFHQSVFVLRADNLKKPVEGVGIMSNRSQPEPIKPPYPPERPDPAVVPQTVKGNFPKQILPVARPEASTGSARKTVERLELELERKLKVYVWDIGDDFYRSIVIVTAYSLSEAQAILVQAGNWDFESENEPTQIIHQAEIVFEEEWEANI